MWQDIEPFITRALNKVGDTTPIENIKNDLLESARQLWMVKNDGKIKAVGVTHIKQYGSQRTGVLCYVSGEDFKLWAYLVDQMADYFKMTGCDKFSFVGRRGWKKRMEARGFKEKETVFERIL